MELRAYWTILWRRIWIVALLFGVVAIYSAYQYYEIRKTATEVKEYHSDVTIRIALQASSMTASQSVADYSSVNDTFAEQFNTVAVLNSAKFASQIVQQIQTDQHLPHNGIDRVKQSSGNPDLGTVQDLGAVAGSMTGIRIHNIVIIKVIWSTPAGAWAIANAAGEVSATHLSDYLDYEIRNHTTATDQPAVTANVINGATDPGESVTSNANKTTTLLLLLVASLLVGIALAFFVDYLDDRLRRTEDAARLLQLPVYGEIPHAPSSQKKLSSRPVHTHAPTLTQQERLDTHSPAAKKA